MPYSAGTAHVTILPEMRRLPAEVKRGVERIGPVAIPIRATVDTAQVRRELAAIKAPEIRANLVVDKSGLAQLQSLARTQSFTVLAELVADTVRARTEIAAVRREADQIGRSRPTVQVVADTTTAVANLARFAVEINQFAAREVDVKVKADTTSAVASIARLVAIVSSLGGLAGVVGGLAGALGGIGAAGAVAAASLAPALLSFRGIGDAVSAMQDQQKTAATTARQAGQEQAQAAAQIEAAQLRVTRAVRDASRARTDGAKEVAQAEAAVNQARAAGAQDVARAVADAEERVQSARENAADQYAAAVKRNEQAQNSARAATRDLQYAQQDLTRAWEDGRRSLQDLQDQLDSTNLDMEQAALDLADAERRLVEARASGNTDEIARADLAYRRQLETIDQLGKRQERLAADNAKAQAAGIAGTEQVVAAEGRVGDARERVAQTSADARDAEAAVERARIDGAAEVASAERDGAQQVADARTQAAQRVASAEQSLTDAREQASRRVQAADEAVADAQKALQQALAQTGTAGQSAADKVAQAFAELSPAAAEFARFLSGDVLPALDQLSATSAGKFLPELQAGMSALLAQLPRIDAIFGTLATSAGVMVRTLLEALASPAALGFFETLADASTTIMPLLTQSIMTLVGAFGQLILALLPTAPAALAFLDQLSGLIVVLAPFIAQLLGGLIPAASAFLTALEPLGPVLAALQPILLVLGQALATVLGAALTALAPVLVALTPLIQQFAAQLAGALVAALVAVTPLLVMIAEWLSANPQLVIGVVAAIAGFLAVLGPLAAILGVALTALRSFLIIRVITAALSVFGPAGLAVARVLGFIINPLSLLRALLPVIARALLALLGPIPLIVVALSALYGSNEQFRDSINRLLGVFAGLTGTILTSLAPALQVAMDIFAALAGAAGEIIAVLAEALVPVVNLLADALLFLEPVIVPLVGAFLAIRAAMLGWAAAQWLLNAAMLANPITLLVAAIAALSLAAVAIVRNWESISTFFTGLWDTVVGIFRTAWDNITRFLSDAVANVGQFFAALPGNIARSLGFLAGMLVRAAIDGWAGFTNGLATAFIDTVAFFQSVPQRASEGLADLGPTLITLGLSTIAGFQSGIADGFNATVAFFTGLPAQITGFFTGAPGWLATVGLDIIAGLVGGLTTAGQAVLDFFTGLIDNFLAGFREGLGIASPSTVFAQFGNDILQGLLNGLVALGQMILDWVSGFGTMIVDAFRVGVDLLTGLWSTFWDGLSAVATFAFDVILAGIKVVFDLILGLFGFSTQEINAIWSRFWTILSTVANAIFTAIRAAIDLVWSVIVGIFTGNMGLVQAAWDRFWNTLQVVANVIFTAIRALIDLAWSVIRAAFQAATDFLAALWQRWWTGLQNIANTVFTAIRVAVETIWNLIRLGFQAAVDFLTLLWTTWWNALRLTAETVFNAIRTAIDFVWGLIRGAFQAAVDLISGVWRAFWDGLALVATTVFGAIKTGIDTVIGGIIGAFRFVVDQIGAIWGGIRSLLAKPVNFMINTVFKGGIVPAWNFVAGLIPGIEPIDGNLVRAIPEFAKGGPVRGDQIIRAGEKGDEYVLSAPAVRGLGGLNAVDKMHRDALTGANRKTTAADERRTFAGIQSGRLVEGADHNGPGTLTQGFGGVKPHVAQAGHFLRKMFGVSTVGGIGQRAGKSDHPRGLALDFMTYSDQAKGDRLSNYAVQNAAHLAIKYIIWKQRINQGSGWKGMEDRGSPTANHFDHPHISFLDGPGGGQNFNGGGDSGGLLGFLNPIPGMIRGFFETVTNPLVNAIPGGPPRFLDIPRELARWSRDKVLDFLLGQAGPENMGPDDGPASTGDQVGNARIIGNVARSMGFARNGVVVALATALQESGLRNLNYGDRDSIGLFQQRPSQGWGTESQIMNPSYSARKFFDALRGVRGWEGMPVTVAAQRVQRSAYPDAYAKHVPRANTLATQVGFDSGGWLPPGATLTQNNSGVPEAVLTGRQWQNVEAIVARGGDGGALIGSLTMQATDGASARHMVEEVFFEARAAKHGGKYRR